MDEKAQNTLRRKPLPSNKKILIFAPHPDDEVIGMGATIYGLIKNNNICRIAYLTSGEKGLKGKGSAAQKKAKREREAIRAIEQLGGKRENLEFLNLRFYRTGFYSADDVDKVFDLITIFMPDIIYLCIDEDPSSTHRKSAEIIDEALIQYPFDSLIYCYKTIWSQFEPKEINCYHSFNDDVMEIKISALKAHRSQEKPLYLKSKKPLWQLVKEKDQELAQKLKLHNPYCEGFILAKKLF